MSSEEVWFSHRENIYEVGGGKFNWTDEKKFGTGIIVQSGWQKLPKID
ncbi:MAG: hypothetical protein ACXQT4_06755 [Methanotrichaceae archaeon]